MLKKKKKRKKEKRKEKYWGVGKLLNMEIGEKFMGFDFLLFGCFGFFRFLGPHLLHLEIPRLQVQLELQLLAYATVTATSDPSHICNLHHSSPQCWILNPLSKAKNQTLNLVVLSGICFCCATKGTLLHQVFKTTKEKKNYNHNILVFLLLNRE